MPSWRMAQDIFFKMNLQLFFLKNTPLTLFVRDWGIKHLVSLCSKWTLCEPDFGQDFITKSS